MRPVNTVDKKLSCVILRRNSTYEIDHSMREVDKKDFPIVACSGLESLSTIRGVFHVVRSIYSEKHFYNAST